MGQDVKNTIKRGLKRWADLTEKALAFTKEEMERCEDDE